MSSTHQKTYSQFVKSVLASGIEVNHQQSEFEFYNVVIIGAGLAGLSAAREFVNTSYLSFKIVEKNNRVGGRTINQPLGELQVDGGAQWVGPAQTEVNALIKELDLSTFKTYTQGESVDYVSDDQQLEDLELAEPVPQEITYQALSTRLNEMASTIPLEKPWQAAKAKEWDQQTVDFWLQSEGVPLSLQFQLGMSIETFLAVESHEVSFFYLLYYIRSAGSLEQLENFEGGAQDSLILEGAQEISKRIVEYYDLAANIEYSGVTGITYYDDFCVVTLENGKEVYCQKVICALMPKLIEHIRFTPQLPANKMNMIKQWDASDPTIKAHVLYDTPFWRKQNRSGISTSDLPAVASTFDGSKPNQTQGILTLFFNDETVSRDYDERKRQVKSDLVALFGEEAANILAYTEMNWRNEVGYIGCESPLKTEKLSDWGDVWHQPIGNIHWAGTETSPIWTGYMEGAIRSGQRAAKAVNHALLSDEQ